LRFSDVSALLAKNWNSLSILFIWDSYRLRPTSAERRDRSLSILFIWDSHGKSIACVSRWIRLSILFIWDSEENLLNIAKPMLLPFNSLYLRFRANPAIIGAITGVIFQFSLFEILGLGLSGMWSSIVLSILFIWDS